MHDIYELMRCVPATRSFSSDPVDSRVLHRVLDNARFAPSGGNRQGWRVIVITDPDLRRALRELYVPAWAAYMEKTGGAAALAAGPGSGLSPARLRSLEAADRFAQKFDEVGAHLLIGVELAKLAIVDADLGRVSISGGASVYPFVQNVLLGLRREGLGAAFTTLLAPAEPQLRRLFAIPDGIAIAGDIAVGHRAEPWPSRLSREPVETFTFAERYGEPWRAQS